MAEDKPKLNNKGPLWKTGVEMFSQISTGIVVPIVAGLVFGKMLDRRYGTEPKIFLLLAGLGFLVTCFGIARIARDYIKKTEGENKK